MFRLKRLVLKNFMTFESLDYEFPEMEPILLLGKNLTDQGQESNGSGKSALQEAIYRNIRGTAIRKGIKDNDLINNESDEAFILTEFHSNKLKKKVVIERTLSKKKSEKIRILINDIECEVSTVNDGNKFILNEIFGLTAEDIDSSFLINREKYISFFFIPDSKKKDLIGRFSNANIINGVDVFVENDYKDKEKLKLELESKILAYNSVIGEFQQKIDSFSLDEFNSLKQKRINEIHSEIHSIEKDVEIYHRQRELIKHDRKVVSDEIKEYEGYIKKLGDEYNELSSSINSQDELNKKKKKIQDDINETNILVNENKSSIREFENKLYDINKNIRVLKIDLQGTITCPKCRYEFIVNSDRTVEEIKTRIDSLTKEENSISEKIKDKLKLEQEIKDILSILQDQLNSVYSEIEKTFKKITEAQDKLNYANSVYNGFIKKRNDIDKEIDKIDNNISNLSLQMSSKNERIKEIKSEEINDPRKDYIKTINEKKKQIDQINKQIEKLILEISEIKEWEIHFKKFFTHLTNKSLKIIEQQTNEQLRKMKSDISIQIEGVKILADGRIKENITPTVLRDGIVMGSGAYGKFSQGEKARIEIANLIARQNIINETNKKGGLDLLWVDEVFDSVDGRGLGAVMNSLKELNKSIFITSHIDIQTAQHSTIKVLKEKGISRIIN